MMKSLMAAAALVTLGACTSMEDKLGLNIPTFTTKLAPGAGITSSGSGDGIFTLDTATLALAYTVNFKDLTGPATMAHIHGPAEAGANAGVVVPLAAATGTQITGSVTLTEAQVAELKAGKYYVNIHTAANKGGEIRGQIAQFMMPEVRIER